VQAVQNEPERADSTGEMMHFTKELLVICNEEDTGGRASVTADKERLLLARITSSQSACIGDIVYCMDECNLGRF